ncbi:uncharacterized protein LOC118488459 [Helianthus annuus]|uniref:uncharacterized protein LOC118488459 n=1 Tax=Helianthus annuus TaxID=4232 RepID=UPI0016532A8E|nr:uncharacterized protein LOC118488459 [Helianthus annuus]
MAYTEESMTPVFASLLKSGIQIFIFWHGLDYEKSKVDHEGLKLKMKSSKIQFEVELLEMQIPLQRDYKESDEKHGILRKRLSDDHSKIVYCIDELGLLCAYEDKIIGHELLAHSMRKQSHCRKGSTPLNRLKSRTWLSRKSLRKMMKKKKG